MQQAAYRIYTEEKMFRGGAGNVMAYSHRQFPLPLHSHDYFEMNIVTEGRGVHYMGAQKCTAKVGDVFLIPPLMHHGYETEGSLVVHHILFRNRFFDFYGARLKEISEYTALFELEPGMREKRVFPSLAQNQLMKLMTYVEKLPADGKTENPLAVDAQAMWILARLFQWHSENMAQRPSKKNEYAVLQLAEYISRHYGEKLTLQELFSLSGMGSMPVFMRCFREVCGKSPIDYVVSVRLQQAERRLMETNDSITQVAYTCGFYDSSQFSKFFRKTYGCTPSAYRQSR